MYIMYLEGKVVKKKCINWFNNKSEKFKQWTWFVILWVSGFLSLFIITIFLRLLINL